MANHSDLTGSELHEPKGIAAASADTTYFSDGTNTGSFSTHKLVRLVSPTVAISSAGYFIGLVTPWAGRLIKTTVTILSDATTTAVGVDFFIEIDDVEVGTSRVSFNQTTGAAYTSEISLPSTSNACSAGSVIELVSGLLGIAATIQFECIILVD